MLFQLPGDLVHIDLGLVILGLHGGNVVGGFFEQAENALLLLFFHGEALQLCHKVRHHVSQFAQILGADGVQGGLGKIGNILLGGDTVLQHHTGILQIDLFRKIQYRLLLRRAEGGQIGAGGLGRLCFLCHHDLQRRLSGQIGGQGQFRDFFFHGDRSFSCDIQMQDYISVAFFRRMTGKYHSSLSMSLYCIRLFLSRFIVPG